MIQVNSIFSKMAQDPLTGRKSPKELDYLIKKASKASRKASDEEWDEFGNIVASLKRWVECSDWIYLNEYQQLSTLLARAGACAKCRIGRSSNSHSGKVTKRNADSVKLAQPPTQNQIETSKPAEKTETPKPAEKPEEKRILSVLDMI